MLLTCCNLQYLLYCKLLAPGMFHINENNLDEFFSSISFKVMHAMVYLLDPLTVKTGRGKC